MGKVWTTPSVLVAKEKYGPRYFDASTEAVFHASSLFLLRERIANNNWYPSPESREAEMPKVELSEEVAATLPSESAAFRAHQAQVTTLIAWLVWQKDYEGWWMRAHKALKEEDGETAFRCLSRYGGDYEEVCLEPLQKYSA